MNAMLKNFCSILALGLLLGSCARPVAKFDYQAPVPNRVPAKVMFTNSSEKADTYMWDFGDGRTSTEFNPTHTFLLSGTYNVTLKAIKDGKSKTTSQKFTFEAPKECYVYMETSKGDMLLELFDDTPLHRDNFVKLAEEGYYDSLLFHRVIDGFMIQGGDPDSRNAPSSKRLGSGGPAYKIDAEISADHVHIKGALAAARQGDAVNPMKQSSGSQFYIVEGKPVDENTLNNLEARSGVRYTPEQREAYMTIGGTPFLDQGYTVFGMVRSGEEVIDAISTVRTDAADRPKEDVYILRVVAVK